MKEVARYKALGLEMTWREWVDWLQENKPEYTESVLRWRIYHEKMSMEEVLQKPVQKHTKRDFRPVFTRRNVKGYYDINALVRHSSSCVRYMTRRHISDIDIDRMRQRKDVLRIEILRGGM